MTEKEQKRLLKNLHSGGRVKAMKKDSLNNSGWICLNTFMA